MADTLNTSAHSKQAVRARCPGSLVFDRRKLLVAALGAGMAGTAKADARLITIEGIGTARLHTAPAARAVLAMVPGFGCAARRYDWLSGLNARGVTVVIPELADIDGLKGMQSLFGHLRSYGLPIYLAGHSAGGSLSLDALETDPARNNRLTRPEGYRPPQDIEGVIVMGASLQPQLLTMVLPYRQEDTPLSRPERTRVMFISGTHDTIATPDRVDKTIARYTVPSEHVVLQGANHYGFVEGHEPTDNAASGLEGAIDGHLQRRATLNHLTRFLGA